MMRTRNSLHILFPKLSLSLSVMFFFSCFFSGCQSPSPINPDEKDNSSDEEQVEEHPDRDFVVFDAGVVTFDSKMFYEDASVPPSILHFGPNNHVSTDLLQDRNPYVRFGYQGFLCSSGDEDRLLLCSSMVRVNSQNGEDLPGFRPEGRLTVLSSRTFEVIKQKDFRAFSRESNSFPEEVFAFDDHSVYLSFLKSKKTYRVDLDTEPQKHIPVQSLAGKVIVGTIVMDGKMYALDSSDSGVQLIEFDPKQESCRTYDLPGAVKIVGRDGHLIFVALYDSRVGVYSLRKHAYIVDPIKIDHTLGPIYGAALDQKVNRLFLVFDRANSKPFVFEVDLSKLSESQRKVGEAIIPQKFAKLNMLTSDPLSGRTRIFVDHLQHKLFVFYNHSEKINLGGQVNIYDLNAPRSTELQNPLHHHALGEKLTSATWAYGFPRNMN